MALDFMDSLGDRGEEAISILHNFDSQIKKPAWSDSESHDLLLATEHKNIMSAGG